MKRYLFIIAICLVSMGWTQEPNTPDIKGIAAAIIVKDMGASLDWYQQLFKLNVASDVTLSERGLRIVNLKGSNMQLELIEFSDSEDQKPLGVDNSQDARLPGFFKIGFIIDDFDARLEQIKKSNNTTKGEVVIDPIGGKRMILILDPDGNRIQFFEQ